MSPSRRSVLRAAASLAVPLLRAQEDPQPHGLTALLEGTAMVRIPPGEFFMGSPNGIADERPVHRVRISKAFEIGKFEVSQSQWETVMTSAHAQPAARITTRDGVEISARPSRF